MNQKPNIADTILATSNVTRAKELFYQAIDTGVAFKLQQNVQKKSLDRQTMADFTEPMPEYGSSLEAVMSEFNERYLPYCYNFSSPQFMGFPDAGNSIAAITGTLMADFLQQNMINQSFCSPSATFAEIAVVRWLREVVGYKNSDIVEDILGVGGVITGGGTTSNAIGMLLARENFQPNTMQTGVNIDDGYYLVVPKGIGHYSVKSGQMWAGCGNKLIEVETNSFRYDLVDLGKKLKKFEGKIMGLVAYAGDSRTMTVDNFEAIADIVEASGQNIWLHADACHGFSLGFSEDLQYKIKGIERFDSITTDPHKVMNSPYTISALLVKDPSLLHNVSSLSDLIMQEQYAFGQITPFIGSKPWISLKLWFALKNIGRKGFAEIIEQRHALAQELADMVATDNNFILINKVDINAVAFMYKGQAATLEIDSLNQLNKDIHAALLERGHYHLHQFSIPDPGIIDKGTLLYPLRFMSGNPNTTKQDLTNMLKYVKRLGREFEKGSS